jgi:hypothetical protein
LRRTSSDTTFAGRTACAFGRAATRTMCRCMAVSSSLCVRAPAGALLSESGAGEPIDRHELLLSMNGRVV